MKKLHLLILLLITATAARSQNLFVYNGNEVTYKNNHFHLEHLGRMDTIKVIDTITENETYKIIKVKEPVSINDRKIYTSNQVSNATVPLINGNSIDKLIIDNIKNNTFIKCLPDGSLHFTINYIVVDEKGKIAYYDWNYMKYLEPDGIYRAVNFDIDSLLSNAPAMKPATLNGKKVPVLIKSELGNIILKIRNHEISR